MISSNGEEHSRRWNDLNRDQQIDLRSAYREHGKYFTNITRSMSDTIVNWLFILNSGGLLSVVTIFASSNNKQNLVKLSWHMGLCFALGIMFIFFASQLEHYRFNKKGKDLDNNFDLLRTNNITI